MDIQLDQQYMDSVLLWTNDHHNNCSNSQPSTKSRNRYNSNFHHSITWCYSRRRFHLSNKIDDR